MHQYIAIERNLSHSCAYTYKWGALECLISSVSETGALMKGGSKGGAEIGTELPLALTEEEKGTVEGWLIEMCPVLELRKVFKSHLGGDGLCDIEFPEVETRWRQVRLVSKENKIEKLLLEDLQERRNRKIRFSEKI